MWYFDSSHDVCSDFNVPRGIFSHFICQSTSERKYNPNIKNLKCSHFQRKVHDNFFYYFLLQWTRKNKKLIRLKNNEKHVLRKGIMSKQSSNSHNFFRYLYAFSIIHSTQNHNNNLMKMVFYLLGETNATTKRSFENS